MSKCIIIQAHAGLQGKAGCIFGQNRRLDKSAGGVHLDNDGLNYQGPWSTIMCWPHYCVLPPGHTPLLSSKPHIPEHLTHHHRVCDPGWGSTAWILHTPHLPTVTGRLKMF